MQIVSIGDNLHEMSKPIFLEHEDNISKYYQACFVLRILDTPGWIHYREAAQLKLFVILFPMGAIFFFLARFLFRMGLVCWKGDRNSQKLCPL